MVPYAFLADATVVLHAAFVLFVIAGQIVILIGWAKRWIWTRGLIFRITHLVAISFVVLEVWFRIPCPLTTLENYLRALAGVETYELSFIGFWLNRLLFYTAPDWVFITIYTAFALLVVVTFIVYPPCRRHDKPAR